jgi:CHASE1-domain containing sensor protein
MVPVRPVQQSRTGPGRAVETGITTATLAAFFASSWALAVAPLPAARASLGAEASALAERLQVELTAAVALAAPLRARLRGEEPVDWKSFDASFAEATQRRPAQELIVWAPEVSAAQRETFEADSGRDAFRSWRIVEAGAQGTSVPAQPRAVHHPIALAAPLARGSDLLGWDLASTPELEAALSSPPGPTMPRVVGPLTLLPATACGDPQRLGCAPQIFVVMPVSDRVAPAKSRSVRPIPVGRGFVLVGLSWGAISAAARSYAQALPTRPRTLDFPRHQNARASFRVLDETWTLELSVPPGGPLSARLGPAGTARGN